MMAGLDRDTLLGDVAAFVHREARLQDEHRYAEWEALWADDGIYWVPANGDDIDPEQQMSIIYDNRSRIGIRVRQLLSGRHYSQEPRSRIRHFVTNLEITRRAGLPTAGRPTDGCEGAEIGAGCNVMVFESNLRGETLWAARTTYLLRRSGSDFKMARKTVALVNNDKPLYTLSFLI